MYELKIITSNKKIKEQIKAYAKNYQMINEPCNTYISFRKNVCR